MKQIPDVSEAEWDRCLDTNLKGAFLTSKHAIGPMRARGGGHIVNVSSQSVAMSVPYMTLYGATKGGLEALTASTHAQNTRARQVLERLGFGLEGLVDRHQPVPGVVMDCAFYALRRQPSRTQNGA